jgi:hypothetical protein
MRVALHGRILDAIRSTDTTATGNRPGQKGALRRLSTVERPITIRSIFASTLENMRWNPTIEQVCDRTGARCFARALP